MSMLVGWCSVTSRAIMRPTKRLFMTVTPAESFSNLIQYQAIKEQIKNKWFASPFESLPKLQSNDVGVVGEQFIGDICRQGNVPAIIDGIKFKKSNGGLGDGIIKDRSVEIKTAHVSGSSNSFQHELGDEPWQVDYMIFLDVSPMYLYLTIFPNFSELHYKSSGKCSPYFPSRSICWRNKKGAFKMDTSVYANEIALMREEPNTIKIGAATKYTTLVDFLNRIII